MQLVASFELKHFGVETALASTSVFSLVKGTKEQMVFVFRIYYFEVDFNYSVAGHLLVQWFDTIDDRCNKKTCVFNVYC